MTTVQIIMRLREIEAELKTVAESELLVSSFNSIKETDYAAEHLENAQTCVRELIEQMLADDRQAREAHTMAELPFDGQKVKP